MKNLCSEIFCSANEWNYLTFASLYMKKKTNKIISLLCHISQHIFRDNK